MNQKNNSIKLKVAFDLFYTQMTWSLWYIPIVLIIYFVVRNFFPSVEKYDMSLISAVFQPSKVYMFVIGIFTCFAFLSHYVKNGVTRKDYFSGSVIAAVGVAFSIIIIGTILNGVSQLFGWSSSITMIEINSMPTWLLPVALSMVLVGYYIAGWVIAVGFYKFGGVGMFFIPVAIAIVSLTDLLWGLSITGPAALLNISFPETSYLFSMASTFVLIGLGLWLIRIVTKEITIDPK